MKFPKSNEAMVERHGTILTDVLPCPVMVFWLGCS